MTKKLSKKKLDEELKSLHYNWKLNNTGTSITFVIKSTSYINALINQQNNCSCRSAETISVNNFEP